MQAKAVIIDRALGGGDALFQVCQQPFIKHNKEDEEQRFTCLHGPFKGPSKIWSFSKQIP